MQLRFVSAPGGSAFMHELLTVVASEVEAVMDCHRIAGVEISEGPLVGDADDVFVVVPHEYFRVLPAELLPDKHTCKRTIGFCVEHPGTETFETTLREARRLGACVDINDDSTIGLSNSGISVERFRLGYSELWDVWRGVEQDRPLDVLYLGTSDGRRSRFLATDPETLTEYEVLFAMPPHEPMIRPRPDFFMGADKHQLLARSKILLNLHRSQSLSFEWVRALEAMSNGCVVVSEHSTDFAPLVPGRHFISGSPHNLSHLARALLTNPGQLAAIRDESYELLRSELTMRPAATMLAELACEVARRPRPVLSARASVAQRVSWPAWLTGVTNLPETSIVRRSTDEGRPKPATIAGTRPTRAVGSIDTIVLDSPTTESTSPGERRNAALAESDADFVLLLNVGDELLPGALERLVAALADPAVDAAYGFVITNRSTFLSALPFEPTRLETTDYLAATSLWRRAKLIELGGWVEGVDDPDETSRELWRHLARHNGFAQLVQRPLVRSGR